MSINRKAAADVAAAGAWIERHKYRALLAAAAAWGLVLAAAPSSWLERPDGQATLFSFLWFGVPAMILAAMLHDAATKWRAARRNFRAAAAVPLTEAWKQKHRTHIEADGFTFAVKVGDYIIQPDGSRVRVSAMRDGFLVRAKDEYNASWENRKTLEIAGVHARRRRFLTGLFLTIGGLVMVGFMFVKSGGFDPRRFLWHDPTALFLWLFFYIIGGIGLLLPGLYGVVSALVVEWRYRRGSQRIDCPKVLDPNPASKANTPSGRQPGGPTEAGTIP